MKRAIPSVLLCLTFLCGAAFAQEPYKLPPKNVLDILDAPPTPRVSLNPARDMMLLTESESMPTIAYLSMPMLRLAGHAHHARQQQPPGPELQHRPVAQEPSRTAQERKIDLPAGIKFTGASWSDDGKSDLLRPLSRQRRRALDRRRRDGQSQRPDRPGPEHGHRRTRAGCPTAASILVDLIPEGRGPAPAGAPRPHRPEGLGLERQGHPSRDLSGPPQDPLRRNALRILRHGPDRPRSTSPPAQSARSASRGSSTCSPFARREIFPGQPDKRPFSYSVPLRRFRPLL